VISLVVLTGPTASGKTELGIELAERLGAEIVSADSQQVYRGLDVGTAKPTPDQRSRVPHHLLDVADPGEGMDAARFLVLADAAIGEIQGRGRLPLVVGGTGLYIRALLHGVAQAPSRDPEFRAHLESEAARLGRAALHRRLRAIDPSAASRIGENDLVRIVRALEIAAGGKTQSELFAAHRFAKHRYRARLLALDPPRAVLHERIGRRIPALLPGLVAEAEGLAERFGDALPAQLPIGYAEAIRLRAGSMTRDAVAERIAGAHRRYARRQLIWLRREPGVEWISPPVDVDRLAAELRTWREAAACDRGDLML